MKPTASFYNRMSLLYPLIDIFLMPQKKVLLNEINQIPSGSLLEIGVGNGSHLKLYKKHEITAIDTSSTMLEAARKREGINVELLQMSGETLHFPDNSFDYVVLSHVITVVNNPELMLKEVFRVIKPTGRVFILNHFTPDNWLKYLDNSFSFFSKKLHFRSVFYIHDLKTIRKFRLVKEVRLGLFSYFKLLIYQK